jgi:hypothetical protein
MTELVCHSIQNRETNLFECNDVYTTIVLSYALMYDMMHFVKMMILVIM